MVNFVEYILKISVNPEDHNITRNKIWFFLHGFKHRLMLYTFAHCNFWSRQGISYNKINTLSSKKLTHDICWRKSMTRYDKSITQITKYTVTF